MGQFLKVNFTTFQVPESIIVSCDNFKCVTVGREVCVVCNSSFSGIYLGMWQISEKINGCIIFYILFTGSICMAAIVSIALFISCPCNEQRRRK